MRTVEEQVAEILIAQIAEAVAAGFARLEAEDVEGAWENYNKAEGVRLSLYKIEERFAASFYFDRVAVNDRTWALSNAINVFARRRAEAQS